MTNSAGRSTPERPAPSEREGKTVEILLTFTGKYNLPDKSGGIVVFRRNKSEYDSKQLLKFEQLSV